MMADQDIKKILFQDISKAEFDKKYIGHDQISSGSQGDVYKAYQIDGTLVAIKYFKNRSLRDDTIKYVQSQIEILDNNRHENILNLLACYKINPEKSNNNPRFCIVTEFCDGNLLEYNVISKRSTLQKFEICKTIVSTIKYAHQHKVMHRDIKPENILFKHSNKLIIKIADFGCSRLDDEQDVSKTTNIGTPLYLPPNIQSGEYTVKCDVYSLGLLIIYIFCGKTYFSHCRSKSDIFDAQIKIFQDVQKELEIFLKKFDLKDFIKQFLIQIGRHTLTKKQKFRFSSQQLEHFIIGQIKKFKQLQQNHTQTPGQDPLEFTPGQNFKKPIPVIDHTKIAKIPTSDIQNSARSQQNELSQSMMTPQNFSQSTIDAQNSKIKKLQISRIDDAKRMQKQSIRESVKQVKPQFESQSFTPNNQKIDNIPSKKESAKYSAQTDSQTPYKSDSKQNQQKVQRSTSIQRSFQRSQQASQSIDYHYNQPIQNKDKSKSRTNSSIIGSNYETNSPQKPQRKQFMKMQDTKSMIQSIKQKQKQIQAAKFQSQLNSHSDISKVEKNIADIVKREEQGQRCHRQTTNLIFLLTNFKNNKEKFGSIKKLELISSASLRIYQKQCISFVFHFYYLYMMASVKIFFSSGTKNETSISIKLNRTQITQQMAIRISSMLDKEEQRLLPEFSKCAGDLYIRASLMKLSVPLIDMLSQASSRPEDPISRKFSKDQIKRQFKQYIDDKLKGIKIEQEAQILKQLVRSMDGIN